MIETRLLTDTDGIGRGDAVLVAFCWKGGPPLSSLATAEEKELEARLVSKGVFDGSAQSAYFVPDHHGGGLLLAGLGDQEKATAESARRTGGKAAALLSENRIAAIVVDGRGVAVSHIVAFLEGVVLGQYRYDAYKKPAEKAPVAVTKADVLVYEESAKAGPAIERAMIACAAANWARDLAHMPSNDLTPTALSGIVRDLAKETGAACDILDEDKLFKLGMNLLIAVSRGSDERATLSILHYTHPEAKKTVALVGKGVTFDTGGISIKPAAGMHEMKYDMCGAAAVLGAMKAIGRLKPKINVVCAVPSAENMTGPDAMTPGEIIKGYNGLTVEIHNTDAEGRLILADALAYVAEKYAPDMMVDVATLTGAVIVGLGHYAAAVMSHNSDIPKRMGAASCATGELIWELPLWQDYVDVMKGTHADLTNASARREAGSITAGGFLSKFAGATPWAHIDIAGTAWGAKGVPYYNGDYVTGWGVRLLTQWLINEAEDAG